MKHLFFICGALFVILTGCEEDKNPLIGTWRGEISAAERKSLDIKNRLENDAFILELEAKQAHLNGHKIKVAYNKNGDVHFVNELGTSRTMSITFQTAEKIIVKTPGHYQQKIHRFELERVPQPQS